MSRDASVDQELVDAATTLAARRRPDRDAVAAALRVSDGSIVTGVALANVNAAMTLCAETGPICTAYTNDVQVIASVCVSREANSGRVVVLAPCGACQERLALWGPDVRVGVADRTTAAGWSTKSLRELNPFYWAASQLLGDTWPQRSDHEW